MSVIVDFMVVSDFMGEDKAMAEVNRQLDRTDTERHQQFRKIPVDAHAGGTKVFCQDVWAGAFNHLIPETIREALCAGGWRFPDAVLVLEASGDYEIDLRARSIEELRKVRDSFGKIDSGAQDL